MSWRSIPFAVVALLCLILGAPSAIAQPATDYLNQMALPLVVDPAGAEADSQRRINSLAASSQDTDRVGMAAAGWVNANAKFRLGRQTEARAILDRLQRTIPVGSAGLRVRAYYQLLRGAMNRGDGDFGAALQLYRQAQQGFIAANDDRGHALALQSLGALYAEVGDSNNAIRYLTLAQETYAGDDAFLLSLHNNLGVAQQNGVNHREAIAHFQRALEIAERVGADDMANRIRLNITLSALHSGQLSLARTLLARIGSASNFNSPVQRADVLGFQAFLALQEGRTQVAVPLISRALNGVDSLSSSSAYRKIHNIAYQVYSKQGDSRQALQQLEAVRRLDATTAEITASNRAAVIAAQFQFAAQDARISRLQAQQRQREVEYQRNVALLIVFGSLIALSLLAALLVLAIRSRNRARRDSAELAVANAQLQRALAAKAEFLASTSHELRTPLNGILGMTQIMLSDHNLTPTLRSQIDLVHDAGTTMRALVDDILDVAKIEHGGFAITPRPTDVVALTARVIRLFEAQSLARGIELRLEAEDFPAGLLLIDPDRMTQILFNLVGNALKFTHEGRVTVRLGRVIEAGGGDRFVLSVADQGIGIAPEWHDSIFDMFSQVDGTRTRQFGGTGLGLAICRQLVRAMDGELSVESAVGEGACFTANLPWLAAEGAAEPLFVAGAPTVSPPTVIGQDDVAVIAPDPLRAALLAAMVRHAGRVPAIIDLPEQIAMLASETGRLCLVDARAIAAVAEVFGQGMRPAATFIIAGEGERDMPEMIAALSTSVDFARNAIVAAIERVSVGCGTDDAYISSLHQPLTSANAEAGANQNIRRARGMSGI